MNYYLVESNMLPYQFQEALNQVKIKVKDGVVTRPFNDKFHRLLSEEEIQLLDAIEQYVTSKTNPIQHQLDALIDDIARLSNDVRGFKDY